MINKTNWMNLIVEDIAAKYSCKAVIDYDQHNITIDGDPEKKGGRTMACHYQKYPDHQKQKIEGNCYICTEDSKNYSCEGYEFYIYFQIFEVKEE